MTKQLMKLLKRIAILAFFFISILFIDGCKKYDENPLINLSSRTHRLTWNKSYMIVGYWINNVDSISTVYKGPIAFSETEGEKLITESFIGDYWNFSDHKKYLEIFVTRDSGGQYGNNPFVTKLKKDWHILKLTDRELHLENDLGGKHYVIHMSKDKF